MSAPFELEINEPGKADVFLAAAENDIPWTLVERFDRAGICVVADLGGEPRDPSRLRRILRGCAGVLVSQAAGLAGLEDVLPAHRLTVGAASAEEESFRTAVHEERRRVRPYAFLVGRLERDFRHARDAIRVAVQTEAGIPCLWADDERHTSNVESVREQTRLLIKHSTFVIADLTLGIESPERENPSRAHEIGMAVAYERPLMLCSQEPRRYPYFSIGDMQMTFWLAEDELEASVRQWIVQNRNLVAREVLNYRLPNPVIARPTFAYDPKDRYIGPKTKVVSGVRRLLASVGVKS
jgi:hypothetical protein